MIVLDTNVLSEVLRPAPERLVVDWLREQPRTSLFTTTVTRGEILYGIWLLPAPGGPSQFDALIAGTARSRGAELATRNVADFEGCDVEVINPLGE